MAGLCVPLSTLHLSAVRRIATAGARHGAMVARYAFHVGLFHSLLYAGLSRRFLPGTVVEEFAYGSVRGAARKGRPYREP